VAFPPPTVTFPSTRLEVPKQFKRLLLLPGGSLPKSVSRFYPKNLKEFFNSLVSKPFGFDSRCHGNLFPSLVALKQCVAAFRLPILASVKILVGAPRLFTVLPHHNTHQFLPLTSQRFQ
jgi:hypothetical protein